MPLARAQDPTLRRAKIEALTIWWNGRTLLRISVNAYNTAQDLNQLADAILSLLSP